MDCDDLIFLGSNGFLFHEQESTSGNYLSSRYQNPNLPGKYSWPLHGGKSELVGCSGRFKGKLL